MRRSITTEWMEIAADVTYVSGKMIPITTKDAHNYVLKLQLSAMSVEMDGKMPRCRLIRKQWDIHINIGSI